MKKIEDLKTKVYISDYLMEKEGQYIDLPCEVDELKEVFNIMSSDGDRDVYLESIDSYINSVSLYNVYSANTLLTQVFEDCDNDVIKIESKLKILNYIINDMGYNVSDAYDELENFMIEELGGGIGAKFEKNRGFAIAEAYGIFEGLLDDSTLKIFFDGEAYYNQFENNGGEVFLYKVDSTHFMAFK